MSIRLRALIVLCDDYSGIARLPGALVAAGFSVAALCPAGSYLSLTRYCDRVLEWPRLRHRRHILDRICLAIRLVEPALVIPGDQRTAVLLQELATGTLVPPAVAALLRRSLGDPAHYAARVNKHHTCRDATALGLRVPDWAAAPMVQSALAFAGQHGYPVVLKRDAGAAGDGVRICADAAALQQAYGELRQPPVPPGGVLGSWARRLRGPYLRRLGIDTGLSVSVMRHIQGQVAMRAVATARGEVLAGISLAREVVHPAPTGPSSVVRIIEHPEMTATVAALIRAWGTYGLLSFDFIIEAGSGHAYLLECNPRPVPVSHLGRQVGNDLCAALARDLRAEAPLPTIASDGRCIALFPQEWRRDANSPWLHSAHHDVPWDDPPLLRALVAGR